MYSYEQCAFIFTRISVDWNGGGVKQLLLLLHRCASFVAKIRTMVLIFPGGTARALDPGLSNAKEAAKARAPGKRPPKWKSQHFLRNITL